MRLPNCLSETTTWSTQSTWMEAAPAFLSSTGPWSTCQVTSASVITVRVRRHSRRQTRHFVPITAVSSGLTQHFLLKHSMYVKKKIAFAGASAPSPQSYAATSPTATTAPAARNTAAVSTERAYVPMASLETRVTSSCATAATDVNSMGHAWTVLVSVTRRLLELRARYNYATAALAADALGRARTARACVMSCTSAMHATQSCAMAELDAGSTGHVWTASACVTRHMLDGTARSYCATTAAGAARTGRVCGMGHVGAMSTGEGLRAMRRLQLLRWWRPYGSWVCAIHLRSLSQ